MMGEGHPLPSSNPARSCYSLPTPLDALRVRLPTREARPSLGVIPPKHGMVIRIAMMRTVQQVLKASGAMWHGRGLALLQRSAPTYPVVVAGHSEGAVVASLLAEDAAGGAIDGAVSLSGPALPLSRSSARWLRPYHEGHRVSLRSNPIPYLLTKCPSSATIHAVWIEARSAATSGTVIDRPPPNSSRTTIRPARSRCSSRRRMRLGEELP